MSRASAATTSAGAITQRGVEVALDGLAGLDPPYSVIERHPPVDAHHLDAGRGHVGEQLAGRDPEVDPRHAQVGHGREDRALYGSTYLPVVGRRQAASPGVEELHR